MIGIRRSLVILQVAADAGVRGQVVVVVDVAIGALARRNGVHPSEGEADVVVIKRRVRPRSGVVALLAGLRQIASNVVGIGGSLVVLQVAGHACRAGEVVITVDVTVGALPRRNSVRSRQRKAGAVVIECRIQPGVGNVARVARRRKLSLRVVRIGGRQVVGGMAGVAIRRHRLELACGGALVTGIAIHRRMCSGKREAVVVLSNLRDRDLPSAYRMTLLAVRTQLSAMNVGVAVLASLSDIGKHRFDVALRATDGLMHAPQGIVRLVVIELRNCANGFPRARGVAVLARSAQISMRAMRSGRLRTSAG